MRGNDFNPITNTDGIYKIDHLKNHKLTLDVLFDNNDSRTITVHMRPTNHLFSREVLPDDFENKPFLKRGGFWLDSYVHHEGHYQNIKDIPPVIKESRIFCKEKWSQSFFFPDFVDLIQKKPSTVTVLANAGDNKTCLSGILELKSQPNDAYLVFFTLTKVNSKEVNMLIASAYCVPKDTHQKAKRLISSSRDDKKPFIVILKNVLEGRAPTEGKKKSNRKHKMRKKKKP